MPQISCSAKKNVNFQALPHENGPLSYIPSVIRMNEKYVFIGGVKRVVIFNRWTRQLVEKIVCRGYVLDMQLNERFLVVQFRDRIDVYDVQKLAHIQTLGNVGTREPCECKFGLKSDVVFICKKMIELDHMMVDVHRWNPSTAQFVRDTKTEHRLKVTAVEYLSLHKSRIYVDEKYLILDLQLFSDRLFKVFSLETMQLVRERKFHFYRFGSHFIRKEYHDGGIVVQTCMANGQPSVQLWDVDKDMVQPMADHPSQFDYSFAMNNHPFQIVIEGREYPKQLLLIQRGQPTGNDVTSMPSQCYVHQDFDLHPELFLFRWFANVSQQTQVE